MGPFSVKAAASLLPASLSSVPMACLQLLFWAQMAAGNQLASAWVQLHPQGPRSQLQPAQQLPREQSCVWHQGCASSLGGSLSAFVPPALVQPRNPTTAWEGRERVLREGDPHCFHTLNKAQDEKTLGREPWDFTRDLCPSCQGWEEQPRAYPGASWHSETKGTAEPVAEEPHGSGCTCKIPTSTAATGIRTSHSTWSGLGAGGQHQHQLCWHCSRHQLCG